MKSKFLAKANTTLNGVVFKARKHSPEILIVTGVVGVVASAVWACVATTKVGDIIDEAKEKIDDIHADAEDKAEKENLDEVKPDETALVKVYAETGLAFVKLYGPPVVLGAISLSCIVTSNNILRERNAAIGAAYAASVKSFSEYRERVVTKYGEDIDKELRYGVKKEKKETIVKDPETGKEKKTKTEVSTIEDMEDEYVKFFGKFTKDENGNVIPNDLWDENPDYRMMHLRSMERYANDLLISNRRVFLNEVFDMLNLPRTKAGQIVGWTYDPKDDTLDNFISFGIEDGYYDKDGYPGAVLEFNVQGNVWDNMKINK